LEGVRNDDDDFMRVTLVDLVFEVTKFLSFFARVSLSLPAALIGFSLE